MNLFRSNWEHCGALFAAEFPSLKKLNMSNCKSLKSEDFDKVGLVALGNRDIEFDFRQFSLCDVICFERN